MKTKYLLFSDAKSPHTIKWLKELVKYYDIYLVSLNGYDKQVLDYISKEKLFVLNESVDVNGGNIKLLLKYFKLKEIVQKIKPRYINAHYLSSYGFLASLIKKQFPDIKLIHSTWGTDVLVTPFTNKINFYLAKFSLKSADLVTSDSYYMCDMIKTVYHNSKVMTFAFGLEEFEIKKYEKDEFLIYSNRALSKNYNIDKVITWFSTLDKRYKLLIANDGEQRESLESMVKSLSLDDRVTFVGFLDEKQQKENYKRAKYYISIPTSDSTSVSLLEAMSFGCYPIVSNLPANREWIIDEFNGIFFHYNLKPPSVDETIMILNEKIVLNKAVFSKSMEEFVKEIKEKI